MVKVTLEAFAGEIPKLQPRQLPPTHAADVTAARLTRGDLAPMRDDLLLTTLGAAAQSFYLHGTTWLSWPAEAEAVPGPVATDRLYITRSDAAPQVYSGGTLMDLALPAPSGGCSAALETAEVSFAIAASGDAHRFTFTDGRWVRSATSIPVTLTRVRASAVLSQTKLFDTDAALRRLVAVMPLAPAAGDALVIANKGEGYLTIHRNGSTMLGAAADVTYKPGERCDLWYYASSTWKRKVIAAPSVFKDGDYTAALGENIAVSDTKGTDQITLPGGAKAIGDVVYVRRDGDGSVKVLRSGSDTIDGATEVSLAKNARHAFVWNGTTWKNIKFGGSLDDEYFQTSESITVEKWTAPKFLCGLASKTVFVDLPTATTGQTCNIGAVGKNTVTILPNGLTVDGANEPAQILPTGDVAKLTKTASGWSIGPAAIDAITDDYTAAADDVLIAYSNARRIDITMPSGATNGETIDIVRIGARAVYVLNMASQDIAESTVYVYTWLTSLSEESAPSSASNAVYLGPGRDVVVTMPGAAPAGRGITHRRIYRSVTSASGITDLYYVGQVTAATTTFTDSTDKPIAEPLPSTDFDPPEATLRGITEMPNGMMAAFSGREVFFCEPYIPHAWPSKYALTVSAQIVGLVALGTSLVVLTKAHPWVIQGIHPSAMAAQKVEADFPCVAMRGIVDMGYAAIYPSTDGLVQIGPDGGAALISTALWDREQWQALKPETFRAGKFISRYAFSYDPDGLGRRMAFVDTSGELPFLLPLDGAAYKDLIHHVPSGRLFGLAADGVSVKSIDDPGAGLRTAIWKSKPFMMPAPVSLGAVKIEALAPPGGTTPAFAFKVYADGVLIHTITTPNKIERLPARKAEEWQFALETNLTVIRARVAGTPDELV